MSGSADIRTGTAVYTADEQLLGTVDHVQPGGILVSGQLIPGTAIKEVGPDRVVLGESGAWFRPQGAERGDRAEEELGPAGGTAAEADAADVKVTPGT